MKNLEVLQALVKTLKKSPEATGRTLAAQLEPALDALARGKGDASALLSAVRAALAVHRSRLDESTPEGATATAALAKADTAARSMPKDTKAVLALERALTDAAAAAKKARPDKGPKPPSFKVRPGTRR